MATIIISSSLSSSYPFASDNVFGIPSTFGYTSLGGYIEQNGTPTVTTDDGLMYNFYYQSGVLHLTETWDGNGSSHDTIMNFDLGPIYYQTEVVFPIGSVQSTAYQLRTDGITFIPNAPINVFDSFGHGSGVPFTAGGVRLFDPTYPATALALADTITNLSTADVLMTGYAGNDTIVGNIGDDTLDGGTGRDSLVGGAGDDSYYVDYGDVIVELVGQGFDTVFTGGTYVAPAGASIERVVATGTAAVAITGNGQAMELIGNAGVNTLDDGGGAATLKGGAGTDVYVVHNAATQVVELSGEGYDAVRTDLGAYTLGANVEVLTHLGASNFLGFGNGLANVLTGGTGGDTLDGGAGTDVLTGGLGADHFRFDGPGLGQDRITDFDGAQDIIELSSAGFGIANLADVSLVAGGAVVAAGHAALIYYANGALAFDANGGSASDAVFFATVDGHPGLSAGNFVLV
ncbi:hypothetical protein BH10PSE4_BH10PSE4_10700 [soil metagenome]